MRRWLCLLSIISVSVASSMLACSSGISSVAPPGDDDSGPGGKDTGGGGGDVAPGDSTSDSTQVDAVLDAPPADGGGGVDAIPPGDGIASDAPEKPCVLTSAGVTTDCSGEEYCDAPTCATGVCRKRPISLPDFNPICGCDGVTYWNDHYAGSLGRSTKLGSGACGGGSASTKTCGGITGRACPGTTECVNSGTDPSTCTIADLSGLCWAIPTSATCVGASGSKKERLCGVGSCTNRCEAIKSGTTFYDDDTC